MVTKTRNYSLFVSVIVLLFIFYSPLFNIKLDRGVFCLTDLQKINKIDGKITSSPVKCSNEKYYSTNILLNKVSTKSNETFSCNGLIKVYIPAKIIEAYFPEKLYSSSHSKKNCIYETGGQYCLSGFYKNNSFYVSECLSNSWENSLKGKIALVTGASYGHVQITIQKMSCKLGKGWWSIISFIVWFQRIYRHKHFKCLSIIRIKSYSCIIWYAFIYVFWNSNVFWKKIQEKKIEFYN